MSIPHGFKARANRIAIGIRRQMQVLDEDPIDLDKLVLKLGLSIVPISTFSNLAPESVAQLVDKDRSAFSALLLRLGRSRVILVNDGHSPRRRNSSIAHEIAHVLLAHAPAKLFDLTGCRSFDKDIEAQANCLAGYILVPNDAALRIVCTDLPLETACDRYGVSQRMLEYRLNTSGARIRHRRWRQKPASLHKGPRDTAAA